MLLDREQLERMLVGQAQVLGVYGLPPVVAPSGEMGAALAEQLRETGQHALLDALEAWLAREGRDAGGTYFWICDFSIRQSGGGTKADVARLGDVVRAVRHTVLFLDPWERPEPLARAWCLWELYHTVDCGARLDVVMSDEQRRRFRRALMNEDGGDGLESITRAVTSIDVERAETRKAKDRDMIMDAVRGSVGFYELNKLLMARMRAISSLFSS